MQSSVVGFRLRDGAVLVDMGMFLAFAAEAQHFWRLRGKLVRELEAFRKAHQGVV